MEEEASAAAAREREHLLGVQRHITELETELGPAVVLAHEQRTLEEGYDAETELSAAQ